MQPFQFGPLKEDQMTYCWPMMFLRCICDDYFNASVQLMSAACVVLLLQALRKINDTCNLVCRKEKGSLEAPE